MQRALQGLPVPQFPFELMSTCSLDGSPIHQHLKVPRGDALNPVGHRHWGESWWWVLSPGSDGRWDGERAGGGFPALAQMDTGMKGAGFGLGWW